MVNLYAKFEVSMLQPLQTYELGPQILIVGHLTASRDPLT